MTFDILPLGHTFNELFTGYLVLGFCCIGLINAVLMSLIAYRYLQVMQQCGYNAGEFLKWLFRKDNVCLNRLSMLSLLSVLGFLLTNMALSVFSGAWVSYCGFILYGIFLFIYLSAERKQKNKIPLVLTKRMIRLFVTFTVLTIAFSILLIFGVNLIAVLTPNDLLLMNFRYAILCLFPILVPFLVLLAYYINNPFEKHRNKKITLRASEKITKYDNLIKIGITGSYAKTTVKEILKTILSSKYKVLATPQSYNTPLGIAKSVNNLDESYDVFIAEMGARRMGDIKELTNIVNPNIAVVTGVTSQHLETFISLNNVKKTKYELIENMKGGKAFFNSDNVHTLEMYEKCTLPKFKAGLDIKNSPNVYATDVEVSEDGTKFTLHYGNESVKCSTVLYGEHNVTNICLAAIVAIEMGLTMGEIAQGISAIKPIKHRLELMRSENGVKILDDGYNANPDGVNRALDVLKTFSGRKYVVTPGIVELGIYENEHNYRFGCNLASVADGVILVGRGSALRIREGLLSSEYPTENIIMVKDLEGAKTEIAKMVKEGDTVLFINDLPDKYN